VARLATALIARRLVELVAGELAAALAWRPAARCPDCGQWAPTAWQTEPPPGGLWWRDSAGCPNCGELVLVETECDHRGPLPMVDSSSRKAARAYHRRRELAQFLSQFWRAVDAIGSHTPKGVAVHQTPPTSSTAPTGRPDA